VGTDGEDDGAVFGDGESRTREQGIGNRKT
jgi:hypothetical protein